MCGILVCYGTNAPSMRTDVIRSARLIRHRGPDWSGSYSNSRIVLAHELLKVAGEGTPAQPILSEDGSVVVVADGNILNPKTLKEGLHLLSEGDASASDVLILLYREHGAAMVRLLKGTFSFALYDKNKDLLLVARDALGVTSLYQGWSSGKNNHDSVFFASEAKALEPFCDDIILFPPGHMYSSKGSPFRKYYNPPSGKAIVQSLPVTSAHDIRQHLLSAVRNRIGHDQNFGVVLSGTLTSALSASIAAGLYHTGNPTGKRLKSFSIDLEGESDGAWEKTIAAFVGTDHEHVSYTMQEALDAVEDTIYQLETFDVATIRAGVPAFLLARKIKSRGFKMILSGEGGDEVFGGHVCGGDSIPTHLRNTVSLCQVEKIPLSTCLQVHKAMMAWGVEVRLPFLDTQLLEAMVVVDRKESFVAPDPVEWHGLCKAFRDPEISFGRSLLPDGVDWKNDCPSVPKSNERLIGALKSEAQRLQKMPSKRLGKWVPVQRYSDTAEACWYRDIFRAQFPNYSASTAGGLMLVGDNDAKLAGTCSCREAQVS